MFQQFHLHAFLLFPGDTCRDLSAFLYNAVVDAFFLGILSRVMLLINLSVLLFSRGRHFFFVLHNTGCPGFFLLESFLTQFPRLPLLFRLVLCKELLLLSLRKKDVR